MFCMFYMIGLAPHKEIGEIKMRILVITTTIIFIEKIFVLFR
ncbi:hypothetical protein SELR_09660 [Selenomonas ruminantium subsp. lactilytica TAM6421]|uniref:Uncharacterized protein n=1 Tax=Selenomonas ruminantium subsp. lactilytica (strain NBRC 103574 / TAM6421) TaxID=927704 RepID=I0GPI7_SELRL|nr:hypothetical protein SELR_09660 [Selenomonas ruminantium subsp. lactilytica TAM6421]